jgi:hypothetical protein
MPPSLPSLPRLPLELEHLIKTSVGGEAPEPCALSDCLRTIDSRKALEAEHYLRACALRLDLDAGPAFGLADGQKGD